MNVKMPRVLIAAPASGSGKTMITCGVLQALLHRKLTPTAFKCGPDYIDPMFHKYVLGVAGGNLDTYFLEGDSVRQQLARFSKQSQITIIEGVMGYYDGVQGTTTKASSYEVAVKTDTPVIFVIDGKGASLSLVALLKGFLLYREDKRIKGVILNRVSPMMAERLKPLIEELGVAVLGCLPECEAAKLSSRHLGLVIPEEIKELRRQMEELADQIEASIDLEKLIKIAQQANPIEVKEPSSIPASRSHVRIGVAQDAAFCFYYQENLCLLEELGAEIITFSPLTDSQLPSDLHGLLLGGGYPEVYAKELSKNHRMLTSIKAAIESELPTLAECGGFLYLHRQLEGSDKEKYPMVGVIDAEAYKTTTLSRFGYISVTSESETPYLKKGEEIKGHEFHYWDSSDNGAVYQAKKPLSTRAWMCMHSKYKLLAGFPHLYYPSNPDFIRRFINQCELRKGELS